MRKGMKTQLNYSVGNINSVQEGFKRAQNYMTLLIGNFTSGLKQLSSGFKTFFNNKLLGEQKAPVQEVKDIQK